MYNKRRKLKRFMHVTVWVLIMLLFSYVVMKSSIIYSSENMRQTIGNWGEEIATDLSNRIVFSNSPLLQYVNATNDENKNENRLTNFVNNVFPINKYSMDAFDENLIKENETYYASSNNLLTYDYKDLLDMMEENQKTETEEFTEETEEFTEDTEYYQMENDITFIRGETYIEDVLAESSTDIKAVMANNANIVRTLKEKKEFEYLIHNFYIVDSSTDVIKKIFNVSSLLKKDLSMKQNNEKPQILICHTHSQEDFVDSEKGNPEDTIVGVGTYLAEILTEQYGYNVIHDTTKYDLVDRNKAYNYALPAIEKTLKKNPTIEVIIDLHRDGVPEGVKTKLVTNIAGKETARLMFFNGLSRNKKGPIDYLYNPHIGDNLALSLQLQIKSLTEYPNFTRKIYLKNYRYNQHLIPKSLLVELGNQNNTVQEAKNAMEPLANILNQVLEGK